MTTEQSLAFVFGTRPEIIKFAPIIRTAQDRGCPFTLIHTGQHYSPELDRVFFDQLELPEPGHNLAVGSGGHGQQTGAMLTALEPLVDSVAPDVVLVHGDTNSTLAGSITTCKLAPELAHVEAGLRSFDRRMSEEHNRVMSDHAADYLFAPTERAVENLRAEGLTDGVHMTGNTIVDAVEGHIELAERKSDALDRLGVAPGEFVLLTAHRAENVDDPDRLRDILDGVARFAAGKGLPCLYPAHPRSARRIHEFGIEVPEAVRLIEPLDFLDFLLLEERAALVVTDSGGVQEEAAILGTPCVTVRENTERQETVEIGSNRLAGTDPDTIVEAATAMLDASGWESPYGDGRTAGRILDVLLEGES